MVAVTVSDLITAMAVSGGPSRFHARNHRPLHEALVYLNDHAGENLLGGKPVPDPEVGLRVRGVTKALWDLCRTGFLSAEGVGQQTYFVVANRSDSRFCLGSMSINAHVARAIHLAADRWACSETRLKKSRQVAVSSSAACVSQAGIPRQLSDFWSLHRAVSLN